MNPIRLAIGPIVVGFVCFFCPTAFGADPASPLGNLKVNGKPWQPLQSFRTDQWDWPESEDPAAEALDRAQLKAMAQEAAQRCEFRSMEEAKHAVEILERLKTLGKVAPPSKAN
jgi:hypothetical protein